MRRPARGAPTGTGRPWCHGGGGRGPRDPHPGIRLPLPGLPSGTHRLGIAASLREPGGRRPSGPAAAVDGLVLTV
ncbi:hypothetical protein [Streptomyces sp. NPDC026673]|uniref:hypothetical protein n=1 Tax=Streptomyces sp. NPDC026673 TaxID=3155724 RepID=UPI0033C8A414